MKKEFIECIKISAHTQDKKEQSKQKQELFMEKQHQGALIAQLVERLMLEAESSEAVRVQFRSVALCSTSSLTISPLFPVTLEAFLSKNG